jgi:peptidoglycan-associated lipoprotein
MMTKALLPALFLALLYGCASQPTEEVKPADAAKPGAGLPVAPPTAARPPQPGVGSAPLSGGLKDPGSLLSKRSVFYEYDRYEIKDEFRPVLQAHGKYLAENRGRKMLVQGNCDERGSREYNIALGQRRAEGVKRTLLLMGAADAQIEAVSLGEEKPRCTDHSESCWSQNRRGDMLYSGEY